MSEVRCKLWKIAEVLSVAVTLAGFSLWGANCPAAVLTVANNGVDSVSCGAVGSPCRSISQAIQNAGAGDTIVVGPGFYGDVNHDSFSSAGDEAGPNTGCNCMINLNKALTILSRDGATATVLDAGGNTLDAVAISANGVTLGGAKKGFTITDADGNGVTISNGLAHVAVIGNRTIANTGDGVLISDGTASNLVSGNISLGNNIGFEVHGANHSVVGNAAPASTRDGFRVEGNSSLLTGNIASDNGFYGVNVISNSSAAIVQNSVLSNTRFGILINSNSTATIKQNNIFGNNEKAVAAFGTNGVTNCGVANASAGTLTLSGNYFGAATGPGVDPADKIVNFLGSSTTNTSFAIKEIKLKPITP